MVHVQNKRLEGVLHGLLEMSDQVLEVDSQVVFGAVFGGLVNQEVTALPGLGKTVVLKLGVSSEAKRPS